MRVILSIDVGGTTVKSAIISETGDIVIMAEEVSSKSNEDKESILTNLCSIIQSLFDMCKLNGLKPSRASVGFPGPFDYENGISKIKDIGKFDSIYNVNIKQAFEDKFMIPFKFANDADLYTLGVSGLTDCVKYNKLLCVCIGTGIGSGFFDRPSLVKWRKGVPLDGFIYTLPFRDGIMDSYLSATGLRNMIKSSGKFTDHCDVKELCEFARGGNNVAIGILNEFGEMLAEGLYPIVTDFGAECLAVGGQVSRSQDLFLTPLREKLAQSGVALEVFSDSTELALRAGCLL